MVKCADCDAEVMIFSVFVGGVICAAPMLGGWYRVQVVCTYDEMN